MTRIGKLGTVDVRLAAWIPRNERYRRHYVPLVPESEAVSARDGGLVVDTKFRPWLVRDWSQGEGFDVWTREHAGYRIAEGVRPHPTKPGLILAYDAVLTVGQSGAFSDGGRFGSVDVRAATGKDDTVYEFGAGEWQTGSPESTGASAGEDVIAISDDGQGTGDRFTLHDTGEIWKWGPVIGTPAQHNFERSWRSMVLWQNRLFALIAGSLYEIDKSSTETSTLVAETPGMGTTYMTPAPRGHLVATDRGLMWLIGDRAGDAYIWHYDPSADTQEIVAQLPGKVTPFWLHSAKGFTFCAYREMLFTTETSPTGPVFVYFKRGAQDGVIGPFRATDTDNHVQIPGIIGSELLISFDTKIWGYDLDTGGIVEFGETAAEIVDALVFGPDLFLARSTGQVYRIAARSPVYQASGTIHLGWHDWDYPGLLKEFLDLTIITEPLPAGTSVTAAVAVDGSATYTALTGTHSTDGETKFTFTVANPTSAPIQGDRFEVRLTLATSTPANTPTIIEVSGRATGTQSVLEVIWQIDAGTVAGQTDETLIAALNGLKTAGAPITVTDPWQKRETVAPETYVATVEDVQTPSVEDGTDDEDLPVAVVKLRQRALVG